MIRPMFTPARTAQLFTEFSLGWAAIVATVPAAIILKASADMDDWNNALCTPPTLNKDNR